MTKGKEVEEGLSKTSVGGSVADKKPTQQTKPGPKTVKQKKGSSPKKDEHIGKKDNFPMQEEQGGGDTTTQGTTKKTTSQDVGPPKKLIIHIGGPQEGQGPQGHPIIHNH
jgi:hypothetical protein